MHVSAPDSLHGGPWPESPAPGVVGAATLPTNFFVTTTTPATAPPALAPRREAMETAPERERDGEGKDSRRSARRKALKRARARAEKYGSAGGGGSGRGFPPPPAAPPTKRSRLARGDHHPDRRRVIHPAPAGADSLDPNGDLAANGGSLATWDERGWVPRPDDAALAAAQAAAQMAGACAKNATRKKIAFRGEANDRPSSSSSSSSSSDASSSSSSDSDSSSGDDEDEGTGGGDTAGGDEDALRDEWLALAANDDHNLGAGDGRATDASSRATCWRTPCTAERSWASWNRRSRTLAATAAAFESPLGWRRARRRRLKGLAFAGRGSSRASGRSSSRPTAAAFRRHRAQRYRHRRRRRPRPHRETRRRSPVQASRTAGE